MAEISTSSFLASDENGKWSLVVIVVDQPVYMYGRSKYFENEKDGVM